MSAEISIIERFFFSYVFWTNARQDGIDIEGILFCALFADPVGFGLNMAYLVYAHRVYRQQEKARTRQILISILGFDIGWMVVKTIFLVSWICWLRTLFLIGIGIPVVLDQCLISQLRKSKVSSTKKTPESIACAPSSGAESADDSAEDHSSEQEPHGPRL